MPVVIMARYDPIHDHFFNQLSYHSNMFFYSLLEQGMLHYKSALLQSLATVFYSLPMVLGFTEEKQIVQINLFEEYVEDSVCIWFCFEPAFHNLCLSVLVAIDCPYDLLISACSWPKPPTSLRSSASYCYFILQFLSSV